MAKKKIWVVVESYLGFTFNTERKNHLFRTKKEALAYKHKSEIAWSDINRLCQMDAHEFTLDTVPETKYEQEECSHPDIALIIKKSLDKKW